MKRTILAAAGIAAGTVVLAAGAANATVSVTDGVGHVDKSDVQSALGWNNAAFDTGVGSLKFTAGYTATFDNTLTCRSGQVTQVPVTSTGVGSLVATKVLNGNGKQITGFDLAPAGGVAAVNDTTQIVAHFWTACSDGSIPVGVFVDPTATVTYDGLKINGVDLPNTPAV